jgi:hypothetical protein
LKIPSCIKCQSTNTCEISYGYPADEEEYMKLVAEKKIYPGGCSIESDSPKWYCNNCANRGGKYSKDTDSFDYEQGFDLDEVYD